MNILGICHDVFICSAAVVVDGTVVAAIPEERLDRKKLSSVFPTLAVGRCLEMAGMTLADIDEVAIAWNPAIDIQTMPAGYLGSRRWRTEHLAQVPARIALLAGAPANGEMTLTNVAAGIPPVTFVDHYHSHIGNGFLTSDADPVAFLVMDGRGETLTSQAGVARGADLE
ncbi:MAG TPA: carbamoyltransferase N-terminal domain-containing protein, partial [Acidimicrobiia bacterium]